MDKKLGTFKIVVLGEGRYFFLMIYRSPCGEDLPDPPFLQGEFR